MLKGKVFLKCFKNPTCSCIARLYQFCLCGALLLASSQIIFAERLPIKTYTVANGLLRDDVRKIKQDLRGFLWFCTAEGISRFDGYAFTNFTTDDGLPDRHVNDFLETRSGEIFVATDGGLARLNPTGVHGSKENPLFKVYRLENPRAKTVNVLFEDENGAIFIGTRGGLFKLNAEDGLETVNLGKSLTDVSEIEVVVIIKDRRSTMWIGTSGNGLFRLLPDGRVETIHCLERITRELCRVFARR